MSGDILIGGERTNDNERIDHEFALAFKLLLSPSANLRTPTMSYGRKISGLPATEIADKVHEVAKTALGLADAWSQTEAISRRQAPA